MDQPDQIVLHEIAIVIVGQSHNPSVLNPDFLRHNNIAAAELAVAGGISTPAFSQVDYQSGLQVVSEPNRISFTEKVSKEADIASPGMAARYLAVVPLVRYTAVGVNLTAHLSGTGGELSPTRLLKSASWMRFESVDPDAEVKLIYKIGGRIVNLTIKTGSASAPNGPKKAVVFHSNFHRDIESGQNESHMVASAIVGKWETDLKDFRTLAENIVKGMKQ